MRAHAIAVFNGKLLLLLSDGNDGQKHPNSWSIIGGHAEGDESAEQTLLREFEEETSIRPSNYEFLTELPEADTNLFLVELSEDEAMSVRIGNEGLALKFFSLSEFIELPLYNLIANEFPGYLNYFRRYLR